MAHRHPITLVTSNFPPHVVGGAELNAKFLADYLHGAGWDVEVVTGAAVVPRAPYRIISAPALRPRPSLIYEQWWARRTARRLLPLIDPRRLFHSFDVLSRSVIAELDARYRVTTIQDISIRCGEISGVLTDGSLCPGCTPANMRLHSRLSTRHRGLGQLVRATRYHLALPYRRTLLERYHAVTAVSDFLRSYVDLPQALVVPDMIAPIPQVAPPTVGQAPSIVAVGRLAFDKGTDLILQALTHLPQFLAYLVGSGDLGYWKAVAASLGVAERVQFIGRVPVSEVATWYQKADLAVLASRAPEASGRTLLEAMSLGRPVVAPQFAGPAEVVTEGSTGRLFVRGDAMSLAGAITRAHTERATLGERARSAAERYEARNVGPRYEALYATLTA